jgi:hypothetical protein
MTPTSPRDRGRTEQILGEIRMLRKGWGLQTRSLERRLGPQLTELVGPSIQADISDLRRELTRQIERCAARLPDDLSKTVLASLGMAAETRHMPFFGDRVDWIAEQSDRASRTALRRIDIAEQLLAEEIAKELARREGRAANNRFGWYLDESRVLLRLDTPCPESHERRRIVATRPDLREVMAWMDVPRDTGQPGMKLEMDVVYGGRLIRREEPSRSRFQFFIQLPAALEPGETHEYEIVLRVPEGDQIRPHYVITPECHYNLFDLRVRFDTQRLPVWVRRVEGETVRMFEAARPGPEQVPLNALGEAHVLFENPALYLGYGLQWHFK